MFLAHHDPPMHEDEDTPGKTVVNHEAVSKVIKNLIENKYSVNEPFVDGNTGRYHDRPTSCTVLE